MSKYQQAIVLLVSISFIMSCKNLNNSQKQISKILSDTLRFKNQSIVVKIDSMNSGISRDLREILPLRDSIEINFDGYWYGTPVTLIHNNKSVYQDTLQTDESTGWSSTIRFKRGKSGNFFDLRIDSLRLIFKEKNTYNFIHISDTKYRDIEVVYTNKGYIYD